MTPQELFDKHQARAERIAEGLCWHCQISGALAFQEEAKQEALQELWRCAVNFDPDKQSLQLRVSGSNAVFWNAVMGKDLSELPVKKSYSNFWIWTAMRVRGRVLDFFRAQRLITRLPKKSEDKPDAPRYTMLYKDRFLSANNPVLRKSSNSSRVSEGGPSPHGEIISYFDLFPSKDRADHADELNDQRKKIAAILESSSLTPDEKNVIALYYGDEELSRSDIAEKLGKTGVMIGVELKSALSKMRSAAERLSIAS